jgi:hypothetical protein
MFELLCKAWPEELGDEQAMATYLMLTKDEALNFGSTLPGTALARSRISATCGGRLVMLQEWTACSLITRISRTSNNGK